MFIAFNQQKTVSCEIYLVLVSGFGKFNRSNPHAVFNLLNIVACKKGTSRNTEFPNAQSSKDTANI